MRARSFRAAVISAILFLATGGVQAQENQPEPAADPPATPTIEELQNQMEELTRQLLLVQEQLDQMKTQQESERRQADLEHLRQAAHAEAARETSAEEVDTTTKYVSGTRMQSMLNPEISVTGDIFVVGGNHQREEMQARHFELDIQSYLDPFTRMHVVFGYHGAHTGVTNHEGDLNHDFLALDLAYDWYPAGRELYRGFTMRGMLLHSWLDLADGWSPRRRRS